jgi:hypothetical protein
MVSVYGSYQSFTYRDYVPQCYKVVTLYHSLGSLQHWLDGYFKKFNKLIN